MSAVLKHRTIASALVEQLREAILGGRLSSGEALRQDALARHFGVSRIPLREALLQLEAEGLVQIVPHKGAVVAGLSRAEVDDVFELRRLLEQRLLRHSAPRLETTDFARLDAIQNAFADAIRQQDKSRWGALNAELHATLYRRAGLPRTESLVANLLTTSERYTRIQLSTRSAWERATAEHAELIALCRAGRNEEACALLDRHIAAVHEDLKALLGQENRSRGA